MAAEKQKRWYESFYSACLHIWDIVYPLGIYYVVIFFAMSVAQLFFGSGESRYMVCQIFTSIVAVPFVYSFYKNDRERFSRQTIQECVHHTPSIFIHVLAIVVVAALLGTALNNLISMSPLVHLSKGFAEANRNFYGSTFVIELMGSAVVTPILEELLFRGIVYGRLREMTGKITAVIISSFIFGALHFNLVQFVYAFLLGMVLSLVMECTGHLYGAVVMHMTANFLAVVRTETGFLGHTADGSPGAWLFSLACLLAGLAIFVIYWRDCRKGNRYNSRRNRS